LETVCIIVIMIVIEKTKGIRTMFLDSPSSEELYDLILEWSYPDLSREIEGFKPLAGKVQFTDLSLYFGEKIQLNTGRLKAFRLEKSIIGWLYYFIRMNVKRGPVFDLRQALWTGSADCLGYGKLFTTLGRLCGLDTGILEVVTHNGGRNVPHTAVMVKKAGEKPHLIDFWYGSMDIRHRRLGLKVKRGDLWQVEDLDFREISKNQDISYLPDECVDAITHYILGNSALKAGEFNHAVAEYSSAIKLYPENARSYYNRALAYEHMHQEEEARKDYARAVHDEAALKRVLAVLPEDTAALMQLDQLFVPELDQQIYLMYLGFSSGRKMNSRQIAKKLDIPLEEVESVLQMVIAALSRQS
jgi:tetratricopeptide (TPR) repeat protein